MTSSSDYEIDSAKLEKRYKIINLLLVAPFLAMYTLLFVYIGNQAIFILWSTMAILLPFYIYRQDCFKQNKMELMLRYGLVEKKMEDRYRAKSE